MSVWIQHLLVLVIVCGAVAFVAWQVLRGLRGKSSRVGSCCARGCAAPTNDAAPTDDRPARAERVVFLPLERLTRSK